MSDVAAGVNVCEREVEREREREKERVGGEIGREGGGGEKRKLAGKIISM